MANTSAINGSILCKPPDTINPLLTLCKITHSITGLTHCTHSLLFLVTLMVLLAGSIPSAQGANFQPNEVSSQETLSLYQKIPGLTSQQIEYGKTAIPKMHYNSQRCLLYTSDAADNREV